MNGNKRIVLDSNILIYRSKDILTFQDILERGYEELFVSVAVYMEVLGFSFENPKEQLVLEQAMATLPIVQTDMEIAGYVVGYRRQRRIKLPDAIILATARKLGADLMTKNTEDFRGIDESVRLVEPF